MTDLRPRTSVAMPFRRSVGHRLVVAARFAAIAIAVVLATALATRGAPASARTTQDPVVTTTSAPATSTAGTDSSSNGSDGGSTTATTQASSGSGAGSKRVADENRKIWLVVGALVAVALALSLLTLRYWRQTKPVVGAAPPDDASAPGRVDAAASAAVAAGARTDAAGASRSRARVVAGARAGSADPAPEVAAEPAMDRLARMDSGRRSRRAVAGADHATSDASWEPRGTGEHDRVEVAATNRVPRPSREQRAAAYRLGAR